MSDHGHDEQPAAGHDAPKPDTSPPRNEVIFVVVVASVATLFGLKFVFDSYLDREVRVTRTDHLVGSESAEALADYREEAAATLAGGAMPIEEAMSELGTRGRAAFVQIRPSAGDPSRAARDGWVLLPVAAAPAAPTPTRVPFTLTEDHMPPADPEADAAEAAAELAPLAAPAPAEALGAPL